MIPLVYNDISKSHQILSSRLSLISYLLTNLLIQSLHSTHSTHSALLTHSFTHSLIYSLIHLLTHLLICAPIGDRLKEDGDIMASHFAYLSGGLLPSAPGIIWYDRLFLFYFSPLFLLLFMCDTTRRSCFFAISSASSIFLILYIHIFYMIYIICNVFFWFPFLKGKDSKLSLVGYNYYARSSDRSFMNVNVLSSFRMTELIELSFFNASKKTGSGSGGGVDASSGSGLVKSLTGMFGLGGSTAKTGSCCVLSASIIICCYVLNLCIIFVKPSRCWSRFSFHSLSSFIADTKIPDPNTEIDVISDTKTSNNNIISVADQAILEFRG